MVARTGRVMRSGSLVTASRWLAVDGTGVGRAVVDLLRQERLPCLLWPVVITGGHAEGYSDESYKVPKRDLLVGLQVMLQTGEQRIAADVPEAAALGRALGAIRVEISESGRA